MTINSHGSFRDKTRFIPPCFKYGFKHLCAPSNHLVKHNDTAEGNVTSTVNKPGKRKNFDLKSPYLSGDDNVSLFSKAAVKNFSQKASDNKSSLPPLVSLYYAKNGCNPAEHKKKAPKSVLTLPSAYATKPQSCTVSDMHAIDHINKDELARKTNKRGTTRTKKYRRRRGKHIKFYDRDAKYCSQMNINLDSSSNENITKHCNENLGNLIGNSIVKSSDNYEESEHRHVWAVLRNINKFRFDRSAPTTENSTISTLKRKTYPRRLNNRKDNMRVVGTYRTEEFAYISRYELDKSSHDVRNSSTHDENIKVKDKHTNVPKIPYVNETNIIKSEQFVKNANKLCDDPFDSRLIYNNIYKNIKADNLTEKFKTRNPILCEHFCSVTNKNLYNKHSPRKINNFQRLKDINNQYAKPTQEELIARTGSGSSKEHRYSKSFIKESNKICRKYVPHYLSGVRRHDLNKNLFFSHSQCLKNETYKREPGDIPKLPAHSNNNTPRLTQYDISRRLKNMNFPIVILGKNEINNKPYKLISDDLPKFYKAQNAMKNYVPPTITRDNSVQTKLTGPCLYKNKNRFSQESEINRQKPNDKVTSKDKKSTRNFILYNKMRLRFNRTLQKEHPKPKQQMKDRMFNTIYRKSSEHKIVSLSTESKFLHILVPHNASTVNRNKDEDTRQICNNILNANATFGKKRIWCKARWANEFIDNVIRKIREGVYYTNDSRNKTAKQRVDVDLHILESKEVMMETVSSETSITKSIQTISKVTITRKCDPKLLIPGFDKPLPALEVKTMNASEISIKHCVTNIMFRFDITEPTEASIKAKESFALIPLNITQSNTKIFKCETSISNKILPAEICTLIPKFIHNITDTCQKLESQLTPSPLDNKRLLVRRPVNKCFGTRQLFNFSLIPQVPMSPALRQLCDGTYTKSVHMILKVQMLWTKPVVKYDMEIIKSFMPQLLKHHIYTIEVAPTMFIAENVQTMRVLPPTRDPVNKCMALIPYVKRKILPVASPLQGIMNLQAIDASKYVNDINFAVIRSSLRLTKNFVIEISSGISFTTIICSTKHNDYTSNTVVPSLKYLEFKDTTKATENHEALKNNTGKIPMKKSKKALKTRKPKSKDKTSLNKITNLEKFCKLLCGGNILANIFDIDSGQQIMSCLQQMNNWTKKIHPNQALLLTLLINRHQTPNLVKYRPLLLQGISCKRITKLNELEMEIEVLEKETKTTNSHSRPEPQNRKSRTEETWYIPASDKNKTSIYEEMYRIAKTAATEYQLPFNKSTVVWHIKSLIEKRKILNPSYLLVMARYVGLGLLKSPIKK